MPDIYRLAVVCDRSAIDYDRKSGGWIIRQVALRLDRLARTLRPSKS